MRLEVLKNHPGASLEENAAASLARFEARHGVIPVTSAYRSVASQQALIDRWDRGGAQNRPPYLYAPARPASAGKHTRGVALDTIGSGITAMHAHGKEFGWFFNYDYDKVHFEYDVSRDPSRGTAKPTKRLTIRQGSRGQDVTDLQKILNKYHGAKRSVNGIFGGGETKAVKKIQKRYGLTQDGIVGPDTWRVLGQ